MKFKDLKEGKLYKIKGKAPLFTIKDGMLFSITLDRYSSYTFRDLVEVEFEDHIDYVSVGMAIEHMEAGGIASYNGSKITIKNGTLYSINAGPIVFNTMLLEPKWVLE